MSQHRKAKPEEFIEKTYCAESAEHVEVRSRLKQDGKEGINVTPHEGKLLQLLIYLARAKTALEVGTLYGYSALWIAEALGENGKLVTLERDPKNAAAARETFAKSKFGSRIELVEGDAVESMRKLATQKFDLVFIDANKPGYPVYLKLAMDMLHPGGIIVGDNTFLFGHMYGEPFDDFETPDSTVELMQEFHRLLAQDKRFFATMIPTKQGLTVGVKLN